MSTYRGLSVVPCNSGNVAFIRALARNLNTTPQSAKNTLERISSIIKGAILEEKCVHLPGVLTLRPRMGGGSAHPRVTSMYLTTSPSFDVEKVRQSEKSLFKGAAHLSEKKLPIY